MNDVLDEVLWFLGRALLGAHAPGEIRRFVDPSGSDANDGTGPDQPYATIGRALKDQATLTSSDTLVIELAGGAYCESIEVPGQVTLCGPTTGPLPEIGGNGSGPVIRLRGPAATRIRLERLAITGGGRSEATRLGGGIAIRNATDVTVSGCTISRNEGYRGGGISVVGSQRVTVENCNIRENRAGTQQTALAGAAVNLSTRGVDLGYSDGDGHGGGVYIERSSEVVVRDCQLRSNQAILLGGGIAVVSLEKGPVTIDGNDIVLNQVCHGPVGGVGPPPGQEPDMPDAVLAQFANAGWATADVATRVLGLLHGVGHASGMGGGIGLERTGTFVTIRGNRIGLTRTETALGNRARRGGGIAIFHGAYPRLVENEIGWNLVSDDGGGISIDQFDPFLPPSAAPDHHGLQAVPLIPREWITVERTSIHHNQAREDGGGIYATGGVRLAIQGSPDPSTPTLVSDNAAGENGGGIRVSYATQLHASDLQIRRNRANGNAESNGGGGIAARNSSVTLERCDISENHVASFGGGGLYFVTLFEGGFDLDLDHLALSGSPFIRDRHEKFDEIMAAVHGFHARVVKLVDCTGVDNRATNSAGAGGWLYAVRTPDKGGDEPLWLSIEGTATAVGQNVSTYDRPGVGTRKRGNVVLELSGRRTGGVPDDRVHVGLEVPLGAIVASTTLPSGPVPAESGPAFKVLVDRDPSHDIDCHAVPGFLLGPQLSLAAVTPAFAAEAGGTTITLTGGALDGAPRVYLGDAECKVHTVTNDTLVFETPARPPGTEDLAVELGWGPRAVRLGAVRVVPPPSLESVEPLCVAPGQDVIVRGAHLVGEVLVELVDEHGAVTSVLRNGGPSETEIEITVPPLAPGTFEVRVHLTATGETASLGAGLVLT